MRGVYRKAHLWDAENAVFDRADDLPLVVDTEHGRIGVMICYDVEFPEWVRAAALAGADLLCAPVNWPLLPRPARRAARPRWCARWPAPGMNRMPIAVCDRAGVERGQDWIGGSVIIDADGYPLAIAEFGTPATSPPTSTSRSRGSRRSTRTTTFTAIVAPICTAAPRYWTDRRRDARHRTAPTRGPGCPACRSGAASGAP